jgi:repressor of nif and glnA expression
MRSADATGLFRPEDDLTMTELTAAQVLALSALAEGRPMTTDELARAVADMGMHLGGEHAAATLQSLTERGMAERTPAASLGKYRITAHGRAWLTSHTSSEESEG